MYRGVRYIENAIVKNRICAEKRTHSVVNRVYY